MKLFIPLEWSLTTISITVVGLLVGVLLLAVIAYRISQLIKQKEAENLRRKQSNWFAKNANIVSRNGGKLLQRVTLIRAIIGAIEVRNHRIELRQKMQEGGVMKLANGEMSGQDLVILEELLTSIEVDCNDDLDGYTLASLGSNEMQHNNYVEYDLGVRLGKVCLCDGGHCNWEADMLTGFIVDTDLFEFKSITITDCNTGEIISENTNTEIDPQATSLSNISGFSPDGNYLLVEMSNQEDILNLDENDVVKIEFKWCDQFGKMRCVILTNATMEALGKLNETRKKGQTTEVSTRFNAEEIQK